MTNLDRLKGTPYLVSGLESFLRYWYQPDEPVEEPLKWDAEFMFLLQLLPASAQEIYHVAHRWPRTWNTNRGLGKIRLCFPPMVAKWGKAEQGTRKVEAIQLGQDYASGKAIVFVKPGDEPVLQSVSKWNTPSDTDTFTAVSVPLEEALVSIILMSLILHSSNPTPFQELQDASLVFSGRWFYNHPINFYYQHEPNAMLIFELEIEGRRTMSGAFQPSVFQR